MAVLMLASPFHSLDFYRQVHLMLSEYIHHVMESLHSKLIESQYNDILTNGRGKARPLYYCHLCWTLHITYRLFPSKPLGLFFPV